MFRHFLALLVFTTTSALSFSQTRISNYHEEKTDKWTVRIYGNDPLKVREYTLNNGLKVITSYNPSAPRISTMIAVKTGSKNDPADHTGLAHYLEHMLFKGTDKFGSLNWEKEKVFLDQIDMLYEQYNHSTDEAERKAIYHRIDSVSQIAATYAIANEFDKMCQAMGASGTNAFTSNEMTVYINEIPSNMLHKWVELEAERYRNPVLRLFHTELEAVYEEKNISLDNDNNKVYEKLYAELFKNHNYGKQTTIGTIEHLKNPSLVAIRDYYNKYYVPNNMAVILSGDFDPDIAADAIAEHFKYMKPSTTASYTFDYEMIHANPQVFEVVGPDAESVTIGYRIQGAGTKEIRTAKLVDLILNNSSAGLIDLNLIKQQKVLSAYSYIDIMNDYSVFMLSGKPKQGQTLEEVRDLLVEQMQLVIDGKFDDGLLKAIILNEDISHISEFKSNDARCQFLMDAFVTGVGYQKAYNELWEMQKISREEIREFAGEFLNRDRVEIFKRIGTDSTVQKVEKPEINPVELNRDKQSPFVTEWLAEETRPIAPVFADFNKITHLKAGDIDVDYVKNTENRLFQLQLRYDYGKFHNKAMPLAMNYLQLIGTATQSAEEISKKMYSLGCKFYAGSRDKRSYITLTGPEENFDAALQILEELLQNPVADENAFAQMIANEEKARADAKLNNRVIASRLSAYALRGPQNPQTWVLSSQELKALKAQDLTDIIKSFYNVPHRISYFGQRASGELINSVNTYHKYGKPKSIAPPQTFPVRDNAGKEVFTVDYDMVQANIYWVNKSNIYNPEEEPVIALFNQYFGGDMSSVVFQNIRESKALAYSTYAYYATPSYSGENNYIMAFIGTQSDKFHDAVAGMNDLLSDLPADENVFLLSKESLKNRLETERVMDEQLTDYYYAMADLGWDSDMNAVIYSGAQKVSMKDIESFHKRKLKNAVYTYAVMCSKEKISEKDLARYGKVTMLSLEDIFGY